MFLFASFNANLVDMPSFGKAPYCFKIQGQIYYQINEALYPSDKKYPQYGQLFIVDPQEAIDYRLANNLGNDKEILYDLEMILREHNILAKSYKMLQEEVDSRCKLLNNKIVPELQLLFSLKPGYDRK